MDLRTRALKASLWLAIAQWGVQTISFVTLLVLARLLGPEPFGLIAIAGVFVLLLQNISDQGFAHAIVQRQALDPAHLDTAFWTSAGLAAALSILLWSLAGSLAALYGQPKLGPVLRAMAWLPLLSSASSVQLALLKRSMDFKTIAIRNLIATSAGAATGIGMALHGAGIWALVGQYYVASVLDTALIWSMGTWRPRLTFSRRHFRDLSSFGIHILGFNLVMQLNRRLDVLMIGYFLSPAALGFYVVGKRATKTLNQVLTGSVAQVALPALSKIQHDDERLRQVFVSVTQASAMLTLPLLASLAILSDEIVAVMLGNDWRASAPVLTFLALGSMLGSALWLSGPMMLAKGRSDLRLRLAILITALATTAILFAYPQGIAAIAFALLLRQLVMAPLNLAILKQLIGLDLKDFFRAILPATRATLGLALTIYAIRSTLPDLGVVVTLLIAGAAGLMVYMILIWIFDRALVYRLFNLARSAKK